MTNKQPKNLDEAVDIIFNSMTEEEKAVHRGDSMKDSAKKKSNWFKILFEKIS